MTTQALKTPLLPGLAPGLLDDTLAASTLDWLAPMLERAACDTALNQSGVLHIVVLDPLVTPLEGAPQPRALCERSHGRPRELWDADYAGFAWRKAELSWRLGVDAHAAQTQLVHRLRQGDTALWGSVVLDGLVVAVSGAEAAYDEAIAGTVAMWLRAAAKAARARIDGVAI